jgi:putative ABC transport system substrate-binding protein
VLAQAARRNARVALFVGSVNPQDGGRWPTQQALLERLRELGWTEGSNLQVVLRYGHGMSDGMARAASELAALQPDVIVAAGTQPVRALQRATTTTPIVMAGTGDPVGSGLVASLSSPGGNTTGVSLMGQEVIPKTMSLLREAVPSARRIDLLSSAANPANPFFARIWADAVMALGIEGQIVELRGPDDIEPVIRRQPRRRGRDASGSLLRRRQPGARDRCGDPPPTAAGQHGRSQLRGCRLPVGLLAQRTQRLPPGGGLCRPHPARGASQRSANRPAGSLRTDPQPEDRAGDRRGVSSRTAAARRRGGRVKRRRLILAAAALPALRVRAQGSAIVNRAARIAFLAGGTPDAAIQRIAVEPFLAALRERGWVEGRNLQIDYRWAEGNPDRLPALLAELLALRPDLLLAAFSGPALAAKARGVELPVVAAGVDNPVLMGLAVSMARPGGRITGVSSFGGELVAKRIQLLRELVPGVRRLGVLMNPASVQPAQVEAFLQRLAREAGVAILPVPARRPDEFDAAFATLVRERVEGLVVLADETFYIHRAAIAVRCRRARLPSVWGGRDFIVTGEGLASYQSDFRVVFERAGILADRILRGADPAEIPFEQSTKLELVINLKAAKAMGIVVPAALRLQADEVIE